MNLADAELEQYTGYPVVKGSISIGGRVAATALNIPAHDRVLMVTPTKMGLGGWEPEALVFWPVIDIKRRPNGFCDVAVADFGLEIAPASVHEAATAPFDPPRCLVVRRAGPRHARVVSTWLMSADNERVHYAGPGARIYAVPDQSNETQSFELTSQYETAGLRISIAGCFDDAEIWPDATTSNHDLVGRDFAIDVVVPWDIFALKDFGSGRAHAFGHRAAGLSKTDMPDRDRDPCKLGDILFDPGLGWLFVKGQLALGSEIGGRFLRVAVEPDSIHMASVGAVHILDNGFATAQSTFSDLDRTLAVKALGLRAVEAAIIQSEGAAVALSLSGDGIGDVRVLTNDDEEPFGSLNWIGQRIRTLSIVAQVDARGLTLSADGDLHPFDPAELERHMAVRRRGIKPALVPFARYSATATIPWAYMVARGFGVVRWARHRGLL